MNIKKISRYCIIILAIAAMSYSLPIGFDKVFGQKIGNPLLFFSPVLEQFVYRESLGGHQFNYKDEDGNSYNRAEFEALLPFLYFRNLERKKLLPVTVSGQSFNAEAIKAGKQGFETKSRHLDGHHQQIDLYPLFNNNPEVAIMPFPEDVFRFTYGAMEFVNADYNKLDMVLTGRFTDALKKLDFNFPATVVGGKTTNLKPFDEGFFIRDSSGVVFHVKRVLDKPLIVRTPIDPALDIQDIVISENRRKEFYGTIFTRQGGLHLISYDNYRLIPLPVDNYRPKDMDFTLLINPLYKTVIVGGPLKVYGTAMDTDYNIISTFELKRYNPNPPLFKFARDLLFPVQISFENPYRGHADPQLKFGGLWSFAGIFMALAAFFLMPGKQSKIPAREGIKERLISNKGDFALVLTTGFFGLIAIAFIGKD